MIHNNNNNIESDEKPGINISRKYAYYALFILTATNILNYVDRNIISIIAADVQKSLHFSDSDLGFLLGTSFAVLYGVFGIAMGRIADAVHRPRFMAAGLAGWSLMTGVSGGVKSFAGLAAARIGVGIGEAAATPCAQPLLVEYFPRKNRAAVLGVYLMGSYVGIAGALILGGYVLGNWNNSVCSVFPSGACELEPWRAAFLVVGLPGLMLAVPVAFLREPQPNRRAASDRLIPLIIRELSAAVPPFTFGRLYQLGGTPALLWNLGATSLLAVLVIGLGLWTSDWAQWIALGIGAYSVMTWAQALHMADPPLHTLTFGCPTFRIAILAGAIIATVNGTFSAWAAPYALRTLHASPAEVGSYLGFASITASIIGAVAGGAITDRWKRSDSRAPVWVAMISLVAPVPAIIYMLQADTLISYTAAYFIKGGLAALWASAFAALAQDLVLSRMRGTAAALYSLVLILISSGLGPYWVGKISTLTGSLTTAMFTLLSIVPIGVVLLIMLSRKLPKETPVERQARADSAGESANLAAKAV